MSQPNDTLRKHRIAQPSPTNPGEALSRQDLAEQVNKWLLTHLGQTVLLDANYIGKLERGVIKWPRLAYRQALRAILGGETDAELGFVRPHRPGSTTTPLQESVERSTRSDLSTEVVNADIHDITLFAQAMAAGTASDTALDHLHSEVTRLASTYMATSQLELFHELRRVREFAFELLHRNRAPTQQRTLQLSAARLCGLQAHVLLDTGHYRQANLLATTALNCAQAAGHLNTQAWIHSVQSLIAYWSGDTRRAVELASNGVPLAVSGSGKVRLLGLQARAAAEHGDKETTLGALAAAGIARERARCDSDEIGGLFDFPDAKQAVYAGTALLRLHDSTYASQAIGYSNQAIELYTAGRCGFSAPDVLAARLDLATAYFLKHDTDAANVQVGIVLKAHNLTLTSSVRKRVSLLRRTVQTSTSRDGHVAKQLVASLESIIQRPSDWNDTSGVT